MSEEHRQWLRDLSGIASGYPSLSVDPLSELGALAEEAAGTPARLGTPQGLRERTAYTLLLYATSDYVTGCLGALSVFRSYIRALDGIRATLDPTACACPDGAHPGSVDGEAGTEAGVHLMTETGRAAFARHLTPQTLAAYDCEVFLGALADRAVGALREAFDQTFGDVDVSCLDAKFGRGDGRVDIVALQKALGREWEDNAAPVALWSARRWLAGDVREKERTGLLLSLWMGSDRTDGGLPPAYARYARAALASIGTDATCEHPRHPWTAVGGNWIAQERAVMHLYMPGGHPQNPVPDELSDRALWDCPAQHAELARTALARLGGPGNSEDT
ncbi:hypothetical protein ACFVWY_23720 [Streptomyces sp. NPDC058195]|uniref:hypothetical protein n=1 Tax=Streptomyces sp. NPDC058195 TaxID=3346375 RepID=UPI0036E4E4AF